MKGFVHSPVSQYNLPGVGCYRKRELYQQVTLHSVSVHFYCSGQRLAGLAGENDYSRGSALWLKGMCDAYHPSAHPSPLITGSRIILMLSLTSLILRSVRVSVAGSLLSRSLSTRLPTGLHRSLTHPFLTIFSRASVALVLALTPARSPFLTVCRTTSLSHLTIAPAFSSFVISVVASMLLASVPTGTQPGMCASLSQPRCWLVSSTYIYILVPSYVL